MTGLLAGGTIGFLGGGNMAEAIVRGAVARGVFSAERVIVSDRAPERLELLSREVGVAGTRENTEVVKKADLVIVAVKPQVAADVLAEVAPLGRPEQTFVSICAGLPARFFEERLAHSGNPGPRVVRVMPNTPALVGHGMTGLCAGRHAREEDVAAARAIFEAVGEVLVFPEELMDGLTAVSGSGPAYLFAFIEALTAGAEAAGFSPEDAAKLALQTVAGAARLAAESDKTPAELRKTVTSPGGTTAAGLAVLEEQGFASAVSVCVLAAQRRGKELADGAAGPAS